MGPVGERKMEMFGEGREKERESLDVNEALNMERRERERSGGREAQAWTWSLERAREQKYERGRRGEVLTERGRDSTEGEQEQRG